MSNAAVGSTFSRTPEQESREIRSSCLSEAIRAHGGTGVDAEYIVSAAERYAAFIQETKAVREAPVKKRPRR